MSTNIAGLSLDRERTRNHVLMGREAASNLMARKSHVRGGDGARRIAFAPALMPPDRGGVQVAEVNADEVRPEEHDDNHGAFQAEHAFGEGVEGDVEDAVEVGDGVHGAH